MCNNNFNKETEYYIMRSDERQFIRKEVVVYLTNKKWLGYDVKNGIFWSNYIEYVLMPRVKKITNYIITRNLCVFLFFNSVTEEELWKIVN